MLSKDRGNGTDGNVDTLKLQEEFLKMSEAAIGIFGAVKIQNPLAHVVGNGV